MLSTLGRVAAVAVLMLLASPVLSAPASAHSEGETDVGYLLVQQALGHLTHDASPEGIDLAMEKVQDALDTKDHQGVDVAQVRKGMDALEAGDVAQARMVLQDSIRRALSDLPAATGTETGTTVVVSELPGRSGMHGQDWLFLIASVAVGLLGGWLAFRFRPTEAVHDLRSRFAPAPTPSGDGASQEGRS